MPVAIFFSGIGVTLVAHDASGKSIRPRCRAVGFLPLVTTRGDRLFIGLLTAAYINLGLGGIVTGPVAVVRAAAGGRTWQVGTSVMRVGLSRD